MDGTLLDLLDRMPVFLRQEGGEIVYWTKGCSELFGYEEQEAMGARAQTLLGTALDDMRDDIQRRLRTDGEWRGRLQHATKDGAKIWTETVWKLRQSAQIGPVVIEQHVDVTRRVELEEEKAVLAQELQHRVSNIIAVVQSLVHRTFADAPREQRSKMDERLAALAEANRALLSMSWKASDLATLVSQIADILGVSDRIRLEGPTLSVSSRQTMALALALHELCTNAVKYGALSRDTGEVAVTWASHPLSDKAVTIRWQESGGPQVSVPLKTGFGTRLIKYAFGDGQSHVDIRYDPEGLICELVIERAQ